MDNLSRDDFARLSIAFRAEKNLPEDIHRRISDWLDRTLAEMNRPIFARQRIEWANTLLHEAEMNVERRAADVQALCE